MSKYMLTIQHDNQKVAYIEFDSSDDELAKQQGESIFKQYEKQPEFIPRWPDITGNFSGYKPRIENRRISKWIESNTITNGWGRASGGYWKSI